ncbi:MAG: GGDEF domain-containing protein [Solirubrobacteraceae bacterium]
MTAGAGTLRAAAAAVVALVAASAFAWGDQGFWACLPGALLLAATAPTPRGGALLAALAVAVAAAVALPPLLPALLVVPASVAVLLVLRMRLERETDAMRHYALRDPLTGLANRRALDERLAYEVARHSRHDERFAVLALDLNGFKGVNDRFGHDAGDEILRDVAEAMVEAVRAQDTVVRLGGDEFCVLAPLTDRARADGLEQRVLDALATVTAGPEGMSASVGSAIFPGDGTRPEQLLAAADAAAVAAKRRTQARRAA